LNEQSELNEEAAKWVSENDALKSVQTRLQAEIDRLRSHLLSVEENHTQELLKGQLREKSLRDALQTAEEKMSDQWRVNDKLAALGDKYRESLAEKERLQQVVDTQEKSLTKLQHVLHQFTREKERDVLAAQKELALKLARAEALQAEKDSEIGHLRRKLSEAQLGLEAAARLTQQLDKTSAALSAAKEEGKHFRFHFFRFPFQFCTKFLFVFF
jgi:thyroid receptor-interacting protein 11